MNLIKNNDNNDNTSTNLLNIQNIEDYHTIFNKMNENNINILIFVADWCAPCQRIKPLIHEQVIKYSENKSIQFIYIHIDKCFNLSEHYKISVLPTIIVMKDKKEVRIDYNEINKLSYFINDFMN